LASQHREIEAGLDLGYGWVSAEVLTKRLKCLPVSAVSFDLYIDILARLGQVLRHRPTGRSFSL
jgi:hypothetical protein